MASTRLQILNALKARLEVITIAAGYNTDAGANVLMGEMPTFGPDDPDCYLSILTPSDAPVWVGENVVSEITLRIAAICASKGATEPPSTSPSIALENLVEDVKRAVEVADRELGGLIRRPGLKRGQVRPFDREPGVDVVGAVLEWSGTVCEQWGTP